MLHVFVDADACPVKEEVYRVARRYGLDVTLVADAWFRVPSEHWLELVVVKEGFDAADDWIVDQIGRDDLLVSDDIILASRCLEKEARALTPRGRIFTEDSIGEALAARQFMADLREAGTPTSGPNPFTKGDRSKFLQRLDQVVNSIKRGT